MNMHDPTGVGYVLDQFTGSALLSWSILRHLWWSIMTQISPRLAVAESISVNIEIRKFIRGAVDTEILNCFARAWRIAGVAVPRKIFANHVL